MSNNPLRQYFRRPAVYLRLPSGGKDYPPGAIEMTETGELPVYPMTAIDEITSRTPDALFNGIAVVELIKSCVPNIKDPWQINSNDLDAVLIAVKAASGGNDLEVNSECPKCKNEGKYGVNLIGVLATLKSADYTEELVINDLAVKFKPLTYRDMNNAGMKQFEIQKTYSNIDNIKDEAEKNKISEQALRSVTSLTMQILVEAIDYVKTPTSIVKEKEFILDFLQNCDKNIYIMIRDYNAKLKASTEIKPLDIKCVECNNEYQQPFTLNMTDFFG